MKTKKNLINDIITENITNENQNQIKELYIIIDNITNENIKELKNEIKILESFHFVNYINEDKVHLTKSSLKNITSIYPHTQSIKEENFYTNINLIKF